CHLGQLRIVRLGFQQRAIFRLVAQSLQVGLAVGDQVFEPGIFARQFLSALRVVKSLGIAQSAFDFGEATGELFNLWPQIHAFLRGAMAVNSTVGSKTIRPYGREAMRADKGKKRYFFFFLVAAAAWAA